MDKVNVNVSDEEPQTVETTYICTCGRVMTVLDDFDTLGSDSGICCPDCGNEKFQSIAELQAEIAELKQEGDTMWEGLNAQVAELQGKIKELERIIVRAKESVKTLQNQKDQLQAELDKYKKELMQHREALLVFKQLRVLYESSSCMRTEPVKSATQLLMRQCEEGLRTAYENRQQEYIQQLKAELDKGTTLKKMCQAIVKYNKNRNPDSEQFLVRRDMFKKIKKALNAGQEGG